MVVGHINPSLNKRPPDGAQAARRLAKAASGSEGGSEFGGRVGKVGGSLLGWCDVSDTLESLGFVIESVEIITGKR